MFFLMFSSLAALIVPYQSTTVPLWDSKVPHLLLDKPADAPTLTIYKPAKEKAVPTAIVVCPGGGYGGLAMGHEGKEIAEYLNNLGVTACVLKYRHAPNYKHPVPLIDAQRAVRITRSRAMDLGVASDRIGIWGFSAGGHLASTVSTHFSKPESLDANDPVDKVSSRPDFSILCYPVITLEPPYAHMGSRRNLLGANPDQALVTSLCNHLQVTKETPPTFLFHTKADKAVPIANSEMYAEACTKAGVPVELVIYDQGQHGVGLAKKDPVLSKWPLKLQAWLQGRGLLNPARGS